MSLKSQKRSAERRDEGRGISPLQKQKEVMGKTFRHELMCLIVFGICIPLLIAAAIAADSAFIFILAALFAFGFVLALRGVILSGNIYRGIRKIRYASEENMSQSFSSFCRVYKREWQYSSRLVCLILTAESGEKYYYVCPKVADDRKFIRENLLNNPVTVCCYRGSSFIKHLPEN